MALPVTLPLPRLDALPLGAHRLLMLTDESLCDACGVRVAFAGREGGASEGAYSSLNCSDYVGDDADSVEWNLESALAALDAPRSTLISANQVHGTEVVMVADASSLEDARAVAARGADGILVDVPGVPAMILTADCLPLVVVSPSGRFIAAHAGWRGTVAHMAQKAVAALAQDDPFDPCEYNAYIGPHIGECCFEVGQEVSLQFADQFGREALAGSRHASMAKAVKADLMRCGISPERVADAQVCTKCASARYFSYRATNGRCGRNGTFAVRML